MDKDKGIGKAGRGRGGEEGGGGGRLGEQKGWREGGRVLTVYHDDDDNV